MLNKKKEMNNNKENDDGVVSVSDKTAETSKSSSQRAPSSTGITQASKRKSPSVSTVTPPSSMNKEMISILREMNTRVKPGFIGHFFEIATSNSDITGCRRIG